MSTTTHGLVCAHHHLYSSLARGMPAPPRVPTDFRSILDQVWWRLDAALDLDIIYWSAALGAAEALCSGTTAIIDHHESPFSIEGSLDAIRAACDMVGVRSSLCYGVTDRWNDANQLVEVDHNSKMTRAARAGLDECERFIRNGGRGMVGVHAAFTCSDDTLQAASELATDLGVGVHIHVAEGPDDIEAGRRLEAMAKDDWLVVHAVHLDRALPGTIVHNPRSNMNNAVGYASPAKWKNRVVLGTDGIGADMIEEARIAFAKGKEFDLNFSPDTAWQWLANAEELFPEVKNDEVVWSYDHMDSPWHCAFTTGVKPKDVRIDGTLVIKNGEPVNFDLGEIRSKAAEAATKLHERLG